MGLQMPYTVSPRSQLVAIVLLSCCSAVFGFISAFPPPQTFEQPEKAFDTAAEDAAVAPSLPSRGARPEDLGASDGKSAVFTCVLPFPFESVMAAWEGGPPDPNFIKEDVVVETSGSEEHKTKTLYVKNPLPFIIRKTFIREEMFIFEEDQRIDLKQRYSDSSCDNKVLENIIKAHRSANMRADPNNPSGTIFEQTMTISVSSAFGKTIKSQCESFAVSLFLSSAKSGTTTLEQSLAQDEAHKVAKADESNGGGIWWTGGQHTAPGANLHQHGCPATPEDSSSGYFSQTLDSWTSWMWPSYFSSETPAATPIPTASTRAQVSSGPSGGCSVWWSNGEEGGALNEASNSDVTCVSAAAASVTSAVGTCGRDEGGEGGGHRQPLKLTHSGSLHRIRRLARHAGSPAIMLAGLAAQAVSAGDHHFGDSAEQWKTLPNTDTPLKRSNSHPELKELSEADVGRHRAFPPPQLRKMGGLVHSQVVGAAAAFVSSSSDFSMFI